MQGGTQAGGERAQALAQAMGATGIGLAGLSGLWWLPAAEPFTLPASCAGVLRRAARAIFQLFDLIGELYGTPAGAAAGLDGLLEARVPASIPRLHARDALLALRPDFQLCPTDDARRYRLVATELEVCPSAQGFAHAMQLAYGLPTDLADAMARLLDGRELLILCSAEWSEFIFDQLAFCKALAERGARARLLASLPLATLDAEIREGRRWGPPVFGMRERPPGWQSALLERIAAQGLASFLYPDARGWPEHIGEALIFRFGYFDCFRHEQLARMQRWRAQGATFLNPTSFVLDSKSLLAALGLPEVRRRLDARDPEALPTLDACIAETLLLTPEELPRLARERADWVIKFAGYDRDNRSWGGRSLQLGGQHSAESWRATLDAAQELPWPVVAQRSTPSARLDITYLGADGRPHTLHHGGTRLRCFMLRGGGLGDEAQIGGVHLTVAPGGGGVSESVEAVQAPVVFRG